MFRFTVMSRLGLAKPLVRLARTVEEVEPNRLAAKPAAKLSPPLRLGRTGECPA